VSGRAKAGSTARSRIRRTRCSRRRTAAVDATEFTLRADKGADHYNIGENQYLAKDASTISDEVTITIGDGEWTYDETTMLKMDEFPELFSHTDHNTLRPA
jgi:hypothetical protein